MLFHAALAFPPSLDDVGDGNDNNNIDEEDVKGEEKYQ